MMIIVYSKSKLMQDTILLAAEIAATYPELYIFLDETPLLAGYNNDKDVLATELVEYNETLQMQLLNYAQSHMQQAPIAEC